MLERLYVHNFRCLENFEFKPGSASILLIGKNGAGKSTIREVLAVVQAIGQGEGQVKNLVKESDFPRGRSGAPMRFELTLMLEGKRHRLRPCTGASGRLPAVARIERIPPRRWRRGFYAAAGRGAGQTRRT